MEKAKKKGEGKKKRVEIVKIYVNFINFTLNQYIELLY